MFETLSLPVTEKRRRRHAMGFAVGLHATALVVVLSSSLWAIQPVQAPLPYVVFVTELVGPPPAAGVPAPRTPQTRGEESHKAAATNPTRPELTQPKVVPEATSPATPNAATTDATESVSDGTDASPFGSRSGVPGGVPGDGEGGQTIVATPPASEILPVGGNVLAPRILEQVKPAYPPAAVAARVEGIVIVKAVINESGRVEGVTVLRGNPLLEEAATDAVRQWRFEPGRLNGRPVRVYFTLTVNFRLKR